MITPAELARLGRETYEWCERRGMHEPVPTLREVCVKAIAEVGEVFDAWVHRDRDGLKWHGPDGKPEGVGPELADVVLFCAYINHRLGYSFPIEPSDSNVSGSASVVEGMGAIANELAVAWCSGDERPHKVALHTHMAIQGCYALARMAGVHDFDSEIYEKHAFNGTRQRTEKRL